MIFEVWFENSLRDENNYLERVFLQELLLGLPTYRSWRNEKERNTC